MDKILLFNIWYQANYNALMRKAHVYERDKDCFHDAYLAVRRFAIACDDVVDYTPYYIATVNKMRLKEYHRETRYVHPDEFFFQCLNVADDSVDGIEKKRMMEDIESKIVKFVKLRFRNDFPVFRYRLLGLSYREISKVLDLPPSTVRNKIITINKSIKGGVRYGFDNL